MNKRKIALLCCFLAVFSLMLPWAAGADPYDDIYLVGVNDTVLLGLISSSSMPVRRGGVVYAPYSVLDNKELGLSYALNRAGGTFTIYNRNQTLIFQLNGAGSADKKGNSYTQGIITRNSVVYIPLRFVSNFFDLTYSFYNLVLPDGTVPIARICTQSATMDNRQFGASAAQLAQGPLNQYLAAQATPSPSPSPTPTPTVTPPPTPQASPSPSPSPTPSPQPATVYLAVACTDGTGYEEILQVLARQGVSALLLFDPAELADRDEDIRQGYAAGHQIGLLLPESEPETAFSEGNEQLSHILRTETNQVAFRSGGAAQGNWWVWEENVVLRGNSPRTMARNLLSDTENYSLIRVTFRDTSASARALSEVLEVWGESPYTLKTPTESG